MNCHINKLYFSLSPKLSLILWRILSFVLCRRKQLKMELLKREEPFFHHFLSSGIGLFSEYGYNLESGVCNHGFFMMAPNRWCPQTKTLQRPLRLSDGTTSVLASITHTPDKPYVSINVYGVEHLSDEDAALIEVTVSIFYLLIKRCSYIYIHYLNLAE